MCGILAIIGSVERDRKKFARALSRQKYRGPDGSAINLIEDTGIFGFNRLAIQDVSERSMQPFSYDGNWIVFNGEIYNFKELRAELIEQGHIFHTTGDVEVLCLGLSAEGVDFIKKLNGIFAFCFYEKKTSSYLIARDLMGVKPLFISSLNKGVIFSSDVQSIMEYKQPPINAETVQKMVLLDHFIGRNDPSTFFQGVDILPRATWRRYSNQGILIKEGKYAFISFETTEKAKVSIEKTFHALLHKAFEFETRSDAPMGVLLSGGIDSATILALATPHLLKKQERIPIFTYYYERSGDKEDYIYSKQVVSELEKVYGPVFDFHAYNMDKPALCGRDIEEAVRAICMPVTDIRQVARIPLYRYAKNEGLKVILNGQGSDEIYYGYYPLDYWISRFFRKGKFTPSEVMEYFSCDQNAHKLPCLNKDFMERGNKACSVHLEKLFEELHNIPEREKQMSAFFLDTILQTLLQFEDAYGMYNSIEVRVPLINKMLAQYIATCDFRINLFSSNSGRHLFRKELEGTFSKEIVYREKAPAPKKKNYKNELLKIVEENIDGIQQSKLLQEIYSSSFLQSSLNLETQSNSKFYGNNEDIILELLGYYYFEKVFG